MTTSFDWIAHHALVRPHKTAVVDLASGRRFTYRELNDRVDRLASVLHRDLGVEAGDRVTVLAHNDSNIFEVQFACWKLGAIFVPLNWRLALPELEFIAGDCSPKVLIHGAELSGEAADLAARSSIPARIVWGGTAAGSLDYEDAIAASAVGYPKARNTHDTPLTIMYTSGTTGRPKGAVITQGMTFWNAVNAVEYFHVGEPMVNLVILPLFHTGGLNCFSNPAFHFGGTNVVLRQFDPAQCLRVLSDPEIGITHTLAVPANFLFMSQLPEFETVTFPTAVSIGVGGSPTPLPLIETWNSHGIPLQQGFGMTETSPLCTALSREDASRKIGSAGAPAMHLEVRVVDEDGNDVGPDVVGELWVRGPNVTPGYWNRPDANAESFTDGFLHTGDAARYDDEGFLYIVDRWKDMYISGGENVYPAEVESVIYQLDGILECAVIGVPDERWVEVGRAVVVRKPGATITETEIIRHCADRLAKFKVPKSVVFIDEIPHNATGKVLKRELRTSHGQP